VIVGHKFDVWPDVLKIDNAYCPEAPKLHSTAATTTRVRNNEVIAQTSRHCLIKLTIIAIHAPSQMPTAKITDHS